MRGGLLGFLLLVVAPISMFGAFTSPVSASPAIGNPSTYPVFPVGQGPVFWLGQGSFSHRSFAVTISTTFTLFRLDGLTVEAAYVGQTQALGSKGPGNPTAVALDDANNMIYVGTTTGGLFAISTTTLLPQTILDACAGLGGVESLASKGDTSRTVFVLCAVATGTGGSYYFGHERLLSYSFGPNPPAQLNFKIPGSDFSYSMVPASVHLRPMAYDSSSQRILLSYPALAPVNAVAFPGNAVLFISENTTAPGGAQVSATYYIYPTGMAIRGMIVSGGRLYVALDGGGISLLEINTSTMEVLHSIGLTSAPYGLQPGNLGYCLTGFGLLLGFGSVTTYGGAVQRCTAAFAYDPSSGFVFLASDRGNIIAVNPDAQPSPLLPAPFAGPSFGSTLLGRSSTLSVGPCPSVIYAGTVDYPGKIAEFGLTGFCGASISSTSSTSAGSTTGDTTSTASWTTTTLTTTTASGVSTVNTVSLLTDTEYNSTVTVTATTNSSTVVSTITHSGINFTGIVTTRTTSTSQATASVSVMTLVEMSTGPESTPMSIFFALVVILMPALVVFARTRTPSLAMAGIVWGSGLAEYFGMIPQNLTVLALVAFFVVSYMARSGRR